MRAPVPAPSSLPPLVERAAAAMTASPVPSPCIGICRMEATSGRCAGCLRSIDEIKAWSRLDDAGKRAVWGTLPSREDAAR